MLAVALVTFFTVYIPMLMLIPIGIYQLITNGVALYHMRTFQKEDQLNLKIYWGAVAIYWMVLIIIAVIESQEALMIHLFAVPWFLAIYSNVITYQRAHRNGNVRHHANPHSHQFLDNIDF